MLSPVTTTVSTFVVLGVLGGLGEVVTVGVSTTVTTVGCSVLVVTPPVLPGTSTVLTLVITVDETTTTGGGITVVELGGG